MSPLLPPEAPTHLLVLGGTGFIGQSVCEALVDRAGGGSGSIRVPARHITRARHVQMLPTVETVQADLHDDAMLDRLARGCDAVINLVGILHGSEAAFEQAHVTLLQRLVRACRGAGVRRIVHLSALGAAPHGPSRYLRSKGRGEAVLRQADLAVTILRPSVVFGDRDRFINRFAAMQAVLPVMTVPSPQSRYQPVWVDDVASAVTAALDDPTTIGQVIECAGPNVYTLRELVQAAGAWSGHPRPVIGLPAPIARAQAMLLECLPGDPPLSRDNIDSMKVDSVASGSLPGLRRLGIVPSSLEGVMLPALGRHAGAGRFDPWRAGARR